MKHITISHVHCVAVQRRAKEYIACPVSHFNEIFVYAFDMPLIKIGNIEAT